MGLLQTAERVSDIDASDNYVYQRSLIAYAEVAKIISGKVLELGTGSGYGVDMISSKAETFTTVDKFKSETLAKKLKEKTNVEFLQMTFPPLTGIAENTFDFVITFQVIEHIEDDKKFLNEIHRVLKPGGKLIVTTPNIKMSITRNPWHVREYKVTELKSLMLQDFSSVETLGVFGNKTVMDYYQENKKSVAKITRFDIFNLQYRLPRFLLQIPYDILNRMNRKKMLQDNNSLTAGIKMSDYSVAPVTEESLDLFYIGTK